MTHRPVPIFQNEILPRLEISRDGARVALLIEHTDEFAAIDFYHAVVTGAEHGVIEFRIGRREGEEHTD